MFKRVYIEISNICNLQCTFCPVVERDKQIMSADNFEKILKQVQPITQEVCLHLMGEPLAHPHFSRVLELCEIYQVPVQITTNGVVLAKKQEVLLKSKCLRQINFSIQSYKDNFPNKDLTVYLIPLMEFSRVAAEVRPELYINFRLWNLGRNQQIHGQNEEVFTALENFFQISINRRIQVENIKSKRLWNKVYLHFDTHFDWPSWDLPFQGTQGRCHALTSHIGIHADGSVVPCCLDKEAQIPLGNCLEQDLASILTSARAVAMKDGFKRGVLVEKFCQHCTYIKRFSKTETTS